MRRRQIDLRLFLPTAAVLLMLLCCGCDIQNREEEPVPGVEEATIQATEPVDPRNDVVFRPMEDGDEISVPKEELAAYETQYPDCNGTWFRDQLTGEDRLLYNAYLYAMENGFTEFELYVADNDAEFEHIREALCLDSPFLEQNVHPEQEWFSIWEEDVWGEKLGVHVAHFSQEHWQRKMEALAVCREIVAGIPGDCSTQEAKMEYLYRYVRDHVDYVMYEDTQDAYYLYDAVCRGQTICDGYSNMLNLLFNLVGVESCEAMGSDELHPDKETAALTVGHTWVVAKLGDTYYNFDPTHDDAAGELEKDRLFYFGISDERRPVKYLRREADRPRCEDTSRDHAFADLILEDPDNNDQILEAAQLVDAHMEAGKTETLLLVQLDMTQKDLDGFMDRCIGKTQKVSALSITVVTLEGNSILLVTAEPW